MRADRLTEADDFDDHKRDLMALKCLQFEQRLPEIAATTDAGHPSTKLSTATLTAWRALRSS